MGKTSKRSKSYYINCQKRRKKNELSAGMRGFICTCNSREKECVKEAFNILNAYYVTLNRKKEHQQSEESSDSESDDIEKKLEKEISDIQNKKKTESVFQQVCVHVNNCIFITTTLQNPVDLSLCIMDDIISCNKAKTKHLVRLLPVQKTCKAYVEEIEKTTKELIYEEFPIIKISFYILFKARNNNSLDREIILKSLSNIIHEYNLEAVADYKTPDLVLNVEVVKNICCLSLLPHYFTKYCKYNIIKLAQENETDVNTEKTNKTNKQDLNEKKGCEDTKPGLVNKDNNIDNNSNVTLNASLNECENDNATSKCENDNATSK